ncbi:mitochondrial ribosome-associated GTPase 2 isoform X2 [Phymastichus coffea]|uniref:mitochondrial ribosome-associated GTPase 2 isoform X2 n=1 Tax=Phymastichus coffea TaxID=108790 RepID=UPI00273B3A70|nr:mitochondrial ribosome-associated GTPase 2 isoform X2 [Phymastichus coffea]
MQPVLRWSCLSRIYKAFENDTFQKNIFQSKKSHISNCYISKFFHNIHVARKDEQVATALRTKKAKSKRDAMQYFVDMKQVRITAGNGGDGAISFLRLWVNDRAGPDGGDGGHGGHVIFEVSSSVKDLSHVESIIQAQNGENGGNKDCFGKNANHTIIKVPEGTIIRDIDGTILADLDEIGMMYIAARGGAGGHEIRSMAHVGLIGLPNAGKSTLLRAITRARPKVAEYPFTTLKPHIGIIPYDDYEQVAVADLPGLIPDSHKNKGLGITFLKHAERCAALMFIIDVTQDEPWMHLNVLEYEISQFNDKLNERPKLVIANKMDLPRAEENLKLLKEQIDFPIIPISAKMGKNISTLLKEIRILYDNNLKKSKENKDLEDV